MYLKVFKTVKEDVMGANRVGRGITPPPSHTTRLALAPGGFF